MTKTNQYYYDKLRDCYNLVCENEQQRNKPAPAPIKKKKPTFEKSKYIKYGSNFADQGSGSRIRTTQKDWDENYKPQKSLKEFIEDSGYKKEKVSKKDVELEEYMEQIFLSAKQIDDLRLWIEFVCSIS